MFEFCSQPNDFQMNALGNTDYLELVFLKKMLMHISVIIEFVSANNNNKSEVFEFRSACPHISE